MTAQQVAVVLDIALILRRGQSGERSELIREMRLIEEPALERELSPVDLSRLLGERVNVPKTENAAKQFRRKTDFSREDREKPSMAETGPPRDVPDRGTQGQNSVPKPSASGASCGR